jgi:hypothetical protein
MFSGNLEPTPGWKGNDVGRYDPLKGDAPRRRKPTRKGAISRMLARLSNRSRRSSR